MKTASDKAQKHRRRERAATHNSRPTRHARAHARQSNETCGRRNTTLERGSWSPLQLAVRPSAAGLVPVGAASRESPLASLAQSCSAHSPSRATMVRVGPIRIASAAAVRRVICRRACFKMRRPSAQPSRPGTRSTSCDPNYDSCDQPPPPPTTRATKKRRKHTCATMQSHPTRRRTPCVYHHMPQPASTT